MKNSIFHHKSLLDIVYISRMNSVQWKLNQNVLMIRLANLHPLLNVAISEITDLACCRGSVLLDLIIQEPTSS